VRGICDARKQGKNGGKKKKRFLHIWRFPYSCVLDLSGTPSGYQPSWDPPSGEPTWMGTFPYNITSWKLPSY